MNISKIQSEADALSTEVMALIVLPDLAGQQLREQTVKIIEGLQNRRRKFLNFLKLNLNTVSKTKLSKKLNSSTKLLGDRFQLLAKFAVPPSIDTLGKALAELSTNLGMMASRNSFMPSSSNGPERMLCQPKSSADVKKQFAETMPVLLRSIQTARKSIVEVKDDLSKFQKGHHMLSSGSAKIEKVNDAINSAFKNIADIKAVVDEIDKKAYSWKLQMNKEQNRGAIMPWS